MFAAQDAGEAPVQGGPRVGALVGRCLGTCGQHGQARCGGPVEGRVHQRGELGQPGPLRGLPGRPVGGGEHHVGGVRRPAQHPGPGVGVGGVDLRQSDPFDAQDGREFLHRAGRRLGAAHQPPCLGGRLFARLDLVEGEPVHTLSGGVVVARHGQGAQFESRQPDQGAAVGVVQPQVEAAVGAAVGVRPQIGDLCRNAGKQVDAVDTDRHDRPRFARQRERQLQRAVPQGRVEREAPGAHPAALVEPEQPERLVGTDVQLTQTAKGGAVLQALGGAGLVEGFGVRGLRLEQGFRERGGGRGVETVRHTSRGVTGPGVGTRRQ